jgi:3-hydroxyacyl-[acyl-carrier-protein] dehydratase
MSRTATPLRAVDDVTVLSATEVVATKRVVADDPYLEGHFPGRPVYPGVFLVESVRQALDALLSHGAGEPRTATLTGITSLRLFTPLVPGDTLTAHVRCAHEPTGELVASAACTRGDGRRVAQLSVEVLPTFAGSAGALPGDRTAGGGRD